MFALIFHVHGQEGDKVSNSFYFGSSKLELNTGQITPMITAYSLELRECQDVALEKVFFHYVETIRPDPSPREKLMRLKNNIHYFVPLF